MANKGPLENIAKWLEREEWRDAFGEVASEHVDAACQAAGIEAEELPDLIDEDAYDDMMHCVLLDFMTRRIGPDQRNIITDYLKRRGWKEPVLARRTLEALRESTMRLYEVSGVVAGESFLARDMVADGEPVRVRTQDILEDLHQWDRVAVRLISRNGQTVPCGPVLIYSHAAADALAERLKCQTEALSEQAPLFTEAWLAEQLEDESEADDLPDLSIADGDPLEFLTVRYPLALGVAADAARARLDGCPDLGPTDEGTWDWVDDDAVVGSIEVTGDAVVLETNSEARARRGQELLTPLLEGLADAPEVRAPTIEELLDSLPDESDADAGQYDEMIPAMLDELYRAVLDQPVPTLGDVTPRAAALSPEGRTKIVAWLKYLENQSDIERAAGEGAGYDFGWMWAELGVADRRR